MTPQTHNELDTAVDQILSLSMIIKRSIERKIIAEAIKQSNLDLTFQHLLILKLLEDSGEMHINEIGEAMGLAKAQMTQYIDKLVSAGMVNRQGSTQDRRKINITLTPKGKQVFEEVEPAIKRKIKEKLEALNEVDPKEFSEALKYNIDVFSNF